ncbi:hypothetical protein LguiA_019536 [Lonicera macranthoides]
MEANKESNGPLPLPPPPAQAQVSVLVPAGSLDKAFDSSSSSSSSLGFTQKRKRFRIDLVPGETTIVSWKKLLSEGKYEIQEEPSVPVEVKEPAVSRLKLDIEPKDDQDKLMQVEKSRTEHIGLSVSRDLEKVEHINEASKPANCRPRKRRKDKAEAPMDRDVDQATIHKTLELMKTKNASRHAPCVDKYSIQSEGLNVKSEHYRDEKHHYSLHASVGFSIEKPCDPSIKFECSSVAITVNQCSSGFPLEAKGIDKIAHKKYQDKKFQQLEQHRRLVSDTNEKEHSNGVRHRDKNGQNELPDLNLPYPGPSPTYGSGNVKDASSGRLKGALPDRAIL